MGVKVARASCFGLSQPIVPQSPSSSQALASAISSPSLRLRTCSDVGPLVCRFPQHQDCSSPFASPGIPRPASFDLQHPWSAKTIPRASSAALDSFSDEEFSKKIQELALQFQLSNDGATIGRQSNPDDVTTDKESETVPYKADEHRISQMDYLHLIWPDEVIPANLERKANSTDIPVSLRIIKRKMQWDEGFREAGESAYCSVKAAFSSMVFIIRELHSFTLRTREIMSYEKVQGILDHVHREMNASFIWLFQQIFSHTPTLMVYVMILLANFTVYSVGSNDAVAASISHVGSPLASTESVSVLDIKDCETKRNGFDSSAAKSFKISPSGGKTTSVGGGHGGGGRYRPVATGTGGEGLFPHTDNYRVILPEGGASSHLSSLGTSPKEEEPISGREAIQGEVGLWNSIVEEASKMDGSPSHESLDHETRRNLVSPVTAKIEAEDYTDYIATEMSYHKGLSQDPNNPLLLANYAQFLYLVSSDFDRAEEYFKRAVAVDPPDAESYNKYASFLWRARGDLCAAEEAFLGAISAYPANSFYAASYAHFLWNTGGEDTCFPLNPDSS
ncbi:hypothetical protein MLD38_025194 [Melastoma candidum]|uniref:Uncharacterized protein n=1 Tax=Melastoma candidum TaxID=119954 RepID=A0ACB9NUQ0_9MYRT|nr:hypothetical protein MLD38_025194 [Melastoma candidum]